jgi:tetratricopeptide (TPR) repeat protein
LEDEHDNLRAALQWLVNQSQVELSLWLTGVLWRFWWIHGHLSEGRRWLDAALALGHGGGFSSTTSAEQVSPELRQRTVQAKALNGAAILAAVQGDYGAARTLFEANLALQRETGNKQGIADSLTNLGNVAYEQGDYGTARTLQEESLALQRETGNKQGIADSLTNLGNVAYEQGDYGTARTLQEESLALRREMGDKQGIADSLHNLGNVAYERGDYEATRALYEESLVLRRELGDKHGAAYSLEGFAELASAQGKVEQALRLVAAAATLRETISAPLSLPDQAWLDRWLVPARQAVSEATRAAAWEAGCMMTLEQAIAYAFEATIPETKGSST